MTSVQFVICNCNKMKLIMYTFPIAIIFKKQHKYFWNILPFLTLRFCVGKMKHRIQSNNKRTNIVASLHSTVRTEPIKDGNGSIYHQRHVSCQWASLCRHKRAAIILFYYYFLCKRYFTLLLDIWFCAIQNAVVVEEGCVLFTTGEWKYLGHFVQLTWSR